MPLRHGLMHIDNADTHIVMCFSLQQLDTALGHMLKRSRVMGFVPGANQWVSLKKSFV